MTRERKRIDDRVKQGASETRREQVCNASSRLYRSESIRLIPSIDTHPVSVPPLSLFFFLPEINLYLYRAT